MKKVTKLIASLVAAASLTVLGAVNASAQDSTATSAVSWDTGLDIYSSYIFRGAKFGTGAAFQPYVSMGIGGLELGAWGSANTGGEEAYEMDMYLSYSTEFGLGVTFTDYYFGSEDSNGDFIVGNYLDYEHIHYFEPSLSYSIGNFSLMGAYGFVPVEPDTYDMYVEASYAFKHVDLTLGGGDGVYTYTEDDGDDKGPWNLCNVTVGTGKEIEITDKFSLPVSGAVTLNPATEGFFIYVGVSL